MSKETFVFLDFETTGLDAKMEQVIEIAALKVVDDGGGVYREIGRFQTFVALNDGMELSEFIVNLTGITPQMLDGATNEYSALETLSWFAGNATAVAHNAPFDLSFMWNRGELRPKSFICTRAMARLLEPNESSSLKDVYKRITGEEIPGHHRAMNDVEAMLTVFKTLRTECERRYVGYRNVVIDSPDRPLDFVPHDATVITMKRPPKKEENAA